MTYITYQSPNKVVFGSNEGRLTFFEMSPKEPQPVISFELD